MFVRVFQALIRTESRVCAWFVGMCVLTLISTLSLYKTTVMPTQQRHSRRQPLSTAYAAALYLSHTARVHVLQALIRTESRVCVWETLV